MLFAKSLSYKTYNFFIFDKKTFNKRSWSGEMQRTGIGREW